MSDASMRHEAEQRALEERGYFVNAHPNGDYGAQAPDPMMYFGDAGFVADEIGLFPLFKDKTTLADSSLPRG